MPSGVRSRLARTGFRRRRRGGVSRSGTGGVLVDLQNDHHLDIVLVERNGEVSVQPAREITLEAGDGLVLFARQDRVLEVVLRNLTGATN